MPSLSPAESPNVFLRPLPTHTRPWDGFLQGNHPHLWNVKQSWRDYTSGFLLDVSQFLFPRITMGDGVQMSKAEKSFCCVSQGGQQTCSPEANTDLLHFHQHSQKVHSSLPKRLRYQTELRRLAGLPRASALKALTVITFNSACAPLAAWKDNKTLCWAHGSSLCPPGNCSRGWGRDQLAHSKIVHTDLPKSSLSVILDGNYFGWGMSASLSLLPHLH